MYMESGHEVEDFKRKSVLAVCWAGTDRSQYIAEELNKRNYFATSAGVLKNNNHAVSNYVTPEDLSNVGIVVFASIHERNAFCKDEKLKTIIKKNAIEVRVLNITESDKDRAHNYGKVDELRAEISKQLDCVGLKDLTG